MFPIVITKSLEGANGRNWPGLVLIDPNAREPAAVFAQELYESRHKMNPVNLLRRTFDDDHRRDMEIMGHEVEVQAAVLLYGAQESVRRYNEATSIQRGYGKLFRHMTVDQIVAAMRGRRNKALAFVLDNRRAIERHR